MNSKGIIFFTENVDKDDCLFISLFNADDTQGQFNYQGKVKKVYHDRVILRVPDGNEIKEVTVSFNDIISYTKL
ncbi:hypothetical protein AB4672_21255 [Bacillus paralicheniformis]|uniref:hypothetical protein n=1 Tax=Bacillus paralicheniformis TaxID=1648923 RepID=UPI0034D1C860